MRAGAPAYGLAALSDESVTEALVLPEQLPINHPSLACGLKAELFIEGAGQLVVAAGDRLAQSEGMFGLECEPPTRLV